MDKIKAIIIDDEKNGRENLANTLLKYFPGIVVVAEADSVLAGIEAIQKHATDLVFLDIEMPDGNGFKVVEFFSDPPFDVIFVTAYDQYAMQAFDAHAVDYLLKPFSADRFQRAIGILKGGENPFNYKRKHLCGMVLHYEKTYYILRSS